MHKSPLLTVLFAGILTACGQLPQKTQNTATETPSAADNTSITAQDELKTIPSKQFSPETLYSLLVAEVAASRRQYGITLKNYTEEASRTKDPVIIARAARLAQFFRAAPESIAMGKLWLSQESDNQEALAILTEAYINTGDPLKALDNAERILAQLDPKDPSAKQKAGVLESIANTSRSVDDETKSLLLARYQALTEVYPTYAAVNVGLSRLHEISDRFEPALAATQRAQQQDKNYLPALLQEVRLLRLNKQPNQALNRLKSELAKQSDNPRLRLSYAQVLVDINPEQAYIELQNLTADHPKQLDLRLLYALVALDLERLEVAKGELKHLLSKGYRDNTISYYLGNIAETQDKQTEALAYYNGVRQGKEFLSAQERIGKLLAKQGNITEAKQHFNRLRQQSPEYRIQSYIAEANMFSDLGKKTEAIAVLDEGVSRFPDNTSLRYNRATLLEQTDQIDAMEADLRHILFLEPDNSSALNALGYFLTIRTERYQEAFSLIEQALQINPDDAAIMDSMGWVLFKLGRHEDALKYLNQAFAVFPDPEVAAHLGEVLWTVGDQAQARKVWSENLKKNPDNKFLLETIKRLNVQL